MLPGAYENDGTSDGVAFSIERVAANGAKETIFHRRLTPREREADRGTQKVELTATLAAGEELLFFVGPGPANQANFDWAYWAGIKIE
jgi:hypothetical protein